MAERASIAQTCQIGVETTSGTSVAANRKLQSMSIRGKVAAEVNRFRPAGQKWATVHAIGLDSTEAKIEGQPTYDELGHLFSSLISTVTPVMSDTSAYTWTWRPSVSSEDAVKTFTVEEGSAVRAHKWTYGLVTGLTLKWDRKQVELSGDMIGQELSDGITMTASPTTLPMVPLLPRDIAVFADNSSAGLGTTRLTRVLSGEFSLTDRFSPLWAVDDSEPSWATHVESEPKPMLKLLMEADAAGMGLLTKLRDGTAKYVRVKVTSDTLAGAATVYYSLTIDVAAHVSSISDFSDEDGVYAVEWELEPFTDSAWTAPAGGKPFEIVLVNKQSAL